MSADRLSRRRLLATLGGGAVTATSSSAASGGPDEAPEYAEATLHVKVYPGWTPRNRRTVLGWSRVHVDAIRAVLGAVRHLAAHAEATTTVDRVSWRVEPMAPIDASVGRAPQDVIFDEFRDQIRERGAVTGECCHLLLWWDSLNHDLGYGGTRWPNDHVGKIDDEGSQTVANVGATERWDSRAVTRNVAIHETLHTFLAPGVVEEVIDSRCDHDLGSAVEVKPGVLEVSQMATAYAGFDRLGGDGARWHGTGCFDHDAFYRHDGNEGIDRWTHTTELSEGTLAAVERYLA